MIEHFYKYKALFSSRGCVNQNVIDMINNDEIYVSSVENLNDPFERVFNIHVFSKLGDRLFQDFCNKQEAFIKKISDAISPFVKDPDELKRILDGYRKDSMKRMEQYKAKNDRINKDTADFIKDFITIQSPGIFSMSETKDSIPMWSHYADEHRGICIEYDGQKFLDTKQCVPVKYVETPHLFSYDDADGHLARDLDTQIYMYKHEDWSYEREWRYIDPVYCDESIKNPSRITGIYLGVNVSVDDAKKFCNMIKDTVNRNHIQIYWGKIIKGKYSIDFQRCDEKSYT